MAEKIAKNIMYCDECKHVIMPGQGYHNVGGMIFCALCYRTAR